MNRFYPVLVATALLCAGCPSEPTQQAEPAPANEAPATDPSPAGEGGAAASQWTCSMHPRVKEPKPGTCPTCKMDLVPVSEDGAAAPAQPKAAGAKVYNVACGCSIPEVGHCGEYAKIDGAFVEITDHGLGSMPFCGKSGLRAKIDGQVEGGKLKAKSVELVE